MYITKVMFEYMQRFEKNGAGRERWRPHVMKCNGKKLVPGLHQLAATAISHHSYRIEKIESRLKEMQSV